MSAYGHGIYSQFTAEHQKEWVRGEVRHTQSTQGATPSVNSIQHDGFMSLSSAQAQQRPQKLSDLRRLSRSTSAQRETPKQVTFEPPPEAVNRRAQGSEQRALPPHMAHHHHFGWGKPQREIPIAYKESERLSYRKYGDALGYCQNILPQSEIHRSEYEEQ